ncbi:dihydropteroate synthase [bacterium]|nr:dihydropteroate synthase [bacterium]
MAIEGLTIIAESINDSVPSTKKLFDANDLDGLLNLAKTQDEKGAGYIDVNVGRRSAEFMAEMIRRVQGVTAKPLSVDSPDPALAEAGLRAYNQDRAAGQAPILNSISPLRLGMFDLLQVRPFMPLLMVSERVENGVSLPSRSAEETYESAKHLAGLCHQHGLKNDQIVIDVGIAPVGSDTEGLLKRVLDSMRLIHDDTMFRGVHMSVGLSNFTHMLPPRRADGSPLKSPLESAFITLAMPLGLDMVIGSVARKYELLPADHPALACLQDVMNLDSFDAIMRVQEYYS